MQAGTGPTCRRSPVRGMALINNAGGSLSSALLLTLLAWGVRWLRAELNRKRREEEAGRQASRRTLGRFFARLSPVALRMLVRRLMEHSHADGWQLQAGPCAACSKAFCCMPTWPSPLGHLAYLLDPWPLQVETGPCPHHIFLLRAPGSGPHDALPPELRGALRLPGGAAQLLLAAELCVCCVNPTTTCMLPNMPGLPHLPSYCS